MGRFCSFDGLLVKDDASESNRLDPGTVSRPLFNIHGVTYKLVGKSDWCNPANQVSPTLHVTSVPKSLYSKFVLPFATPSVLQPVT